MTYQLMKALIEPNLSSACNSQDLICLLIAINYASYEPVFKSKCPCLFFSYTVNGGHQTQNIIVIKSTQIIYINIPGCIHGGLCVWMHKNRGIWVVSTYHFCTSIIHAQYIQSQTLFKMRRRMCHKKHIASESFT